MTRNELQEHMYENILKAEKNQTRAFLGKIKAQEDKQIHEKFNYDEISVIATLLTKNTKDGRKYREDILDPKKGYKQFLLDN